MGEGGCERREKEQDDETFRLPSFSSDLHLASPSSPSPLSSPQTRGKDDAVPIRWQCPEAVLTRVYTAKSDVYSFGVLLYEIYSRGGVPYGSLATGEVLNMVKAGELLPRPNSDMSEEMFQLMRACTTLHVSQRPTMATVHSQLCSAWTTTAAAMAPGQAPGEHGKAERAPSGMAMNVGLILSQEYDDAEPVDIDNETSL